MGARKFEYFVLLAEMRTGSNFLEANLNTLEGVSCLGELFNPHFIGYPNRDDVLGMSLGDRDQDPFRLLGLVRTAPGKMWGFRYFHDHDPRVLDHVLDDTRCAKIILTRNPAESYVSLKIAQKTNQWKLTDVKRRKTAQAEFDAAEFEAHVTRLQAFQVHVLNRLQCSGQTAFYLAYEDLQDLDVLNGLAAYLGVDARLAQLDASLKVQNPKSLSSKVSNYKDMEQALGDADRFNLSRTPNFEPRRGPSIPSYLAGTNVPLLFLPISGACERQIETWMRELDPDLRTGFNQKELRAWKRERPGHRSFTLVRHPVARAYDVFCQKILGTGDGSYPKIRRALTKRYGLSLPESPDDVAAHRSAFLTFLDFVKANLSGQTAIRVDQSWSSQVAILQGFASFCVPDCVIRDANASKELPGLVKLLGVRDCEVPAPSEDFAGVSLADIYDDTVETRVRSVYQRDYLMFGFDRWKA